MESKRHVLVSDTRKARRRKTTANEFSRRDWKGHRPSTTEGKAAVQREAVQLIVKGALILALLPWVIAALSGLIAMTSSK